MKEPDKMVNAPREFSICGRTVSLLRLPLFEILMYAEKAVRAEHMEGTLRASVSIDDEHKDAFIAKRLQTLTQSYLNSIEGSMRVLFHAVSKKVPDLDFNEFTAFMSDNLQVYKDLSGFIMGGPANPFPESPAKK